jgi:hypothetical protein
MEQDLGLSLESRRTMKNLSHQVSKRWTALGAACLCSAAGAAVADKAGWYSGGGYVDFLDAPGPGGSVAFGDFDADGYADLVQWAPDGAVHLHSRFAEYDQRSVIGQLDAFAVTRSGSDRIWGVAGGVLCEVVPASQVPWPTPPSGFTVSGAATLRAVERPAGSRLLVIDTAGTRLRVFSVGTSSLSPLLERYATTAEGHYHDALLGDWEANGTDQLAFACDIGGKILQDNGADLGILPAAPTDAFLDVLPAGETQWGRDLFFFHHRATATAPAALLVLNSVHAEFLDVETLDLDHLCWADFSESPRRELILPHGGSRRALVLSQKTTTTAAEPVFWVDPSPEAVSVIGLTQQGQDVDSGPLGAPPTAVADLDGDLDEDVLFADDRSLGFVVTSGWHDPKIVTGGAEIMPVIQEFPAGVYTFFYDRPLEVPEGTETVEVEVWYQPDLESPLDPEPHLEIFTAPFDCQFSYEVPEPGEGVYQILVRAVTASGETPPVDVRLWGEHPQVHVAITEANPLFYPWTEWATDAGGTVERPHIGPGEGTGPH